MTDLTNLKPYDAIGLGIASALVVIFCTPFGWIGVAVAFACWSFLR
ncbi:hypothetical protein [Phenylobacterium sp. J367]|nr:hypothetical protein [Phenylobacterium sp. J367]MCR5876954.1 hypothetical protein [Phenylobacterium sp. J367]MCR5877022.1 hypothetical protein [Phenylobacterium sp. J367]